MGGEGRGRKEEERKGAWERMCVDGSLRISPPSILIISPTHPSKHATHHPPHTPPTNHPLHSSSHSSSLSLISNIPNHHKQIKTHSTCIESCGGAAGGAAKRWAARLHELVADDGLDAVHHPLAAAAQARQECLQHRAAARLPLPQPPVGGRQLARVGAAGGWGWGRAAGGLGARGWGRECRVI